MPDTPVSYPPMKNPGESPVGSKAMTGVSRRRLDSAPTLEEEAAVEVEVTGPWSRPGRGAPRTVTPSPWVVDVALVPVDGTGKPWSPPLRWVPPGSPTPGAREEEEEESEESAPESGLNPTGLAWALGCVPPPPPRASCRGKVAGDTSGAGENTSL
jgi:hypothetical protein